MSLHFFVAGLPCLYFLGFGADAMKMCAGEREYTPAGVTDAGKSNRHWDSPSPRWRG